MQAQSAVLLVALVALSATSVRALTAFGKSTNPEKDAKTPTPKVQRGRVCSSQSDCVGISSTTCNLDATDGKKHCQCRDGTVPVNGKCAIIPSVPGKACTEHAECVINAECIVTNNETRKRACTCKDGYEFDASVDDTMCSGCGGLLPCLVTVLVTLLVLLVTDRRTAVVTL